MDCERHSMLYHWISLVCLLLAFHLEVQCRRDAVGIASLGEVHPIRVVLFCGGTEDIMDPELVRSCVRASFSVVKRLD